MADRAPARSFHPRVAALAERHLRRIQFVRGDVAFAEGSMTILALRSIHQVESLIEKDELGEFAHAYPRHRPFRRGILHQLRMGGLSFAISTWQAMQMAVGGKPISAPNFAGGGVTVLAREFDRTGVRFMAERKRCSVAPRSRARGDSARNGHRRVSKS